MDGAYSVVLLDWQGKGRWVMGQRRILVVDDCVDTIELLKAALEERYEVYGIQESVRVFDAVELAEPDLVILDLMMPLVSGFDILDELPRCPPIIRTTPFVILSCKRNLEDQKKAYAKGAKLYFSKPFEPERLLKLIDMFFENSRAPERAKRHRLKEVERLIELRGHYKLSHLGLGHGMLAPLAHEADVEKIGADRGTTEADEKKKDKLGPQRWLN
jgi:CheY-like chemotaxis protein